MMEEKLIKALGNPYGTSNLSSLRDKIESLSRKELVKMCEDVGAWHGINFSEFQLKQSIVDKFKKDPRAISQEMPKSKGVVLDPENPAVIALKKAGLI